MVAGQSAIHVVQHGIVVSMRAAPRIFRDLKMVSNVDEYMQQTNCTLHSSYPDENSALDAANDLLNAGGYQIVYITRQSHEEPLRLWFR